MEDASFRGMGSKTQIGMMEGGSEPQEDNRRDVSNCLKNGKWAIVVGGQLAVNASLSGLQHKMTGKHHFERVSFPLNAE